MSTPIVLTVGQLVGVAALVAMSTMLAYLLGHALGTGHRRDTGPPD